MHADALIRRYVMEDDVSLSVAQLREALTASGVEQGLAQLRATLRRLFPSTRQCGYDPGLMDGLSLTTEGREAVLWSGRLAEEGMPAELPAEEAESTDPDVMDCIVTSGEMERARDYASIAESHLRDWPWSNPIERRIWDCHVRGMNAEEIGRRFDRRQQTVRRVIDRHRRHCGLGRQNTHGRTFGGPELEYELTTEWASQTDRRAWRLVAVERWPWLTAADEMGVTVGWLRRTVERHRARL